MVLIPANLSMNGDKMNTDKPGYCLANKEVIEDHEQRIKDLESGGGVSSIQGVDPINIATVEGTTNISLKTGQGLTVDDNGFVGVNINTNKGLVLENGKLKVNLETETSTINYDSVSGKIYANINGMLKNGEDITFDSWGELLPRAIKPNINGKITTGEGILYATTQSLCGASAIKEALSVKQNKLTAPVTGGLIINGQMDNLIGINFKANGGVTYDENGAVMVDDTVVQKKLTAGNGITISSNTVSAKPQITSARIKVVGTGESGQPPSITIESGKTYILDITSYVNSITPTGYSRLSQGSIFCISLNPDGIIPMYFYEYQNRIMARLFNVAGVDLLCNNMWIEVLFKLDI